MTLKDWIEKRGITQSDFARRVGVQQSTVNKIIHGHRKPSMRVAYAIEVATNGAIKSESWLL